MTREGGGFRARALTVPISPSAAPVYDNIHDQTKGYLGMGSA